MSARKRDVGVGGVQTVLAAEASGRTRVVLNLDSLVPYETHVEGNRLVITLGQGEHRGRCDDGLRARAGSSNRPWRLPAPGVKQINSIDFRRGEDGAGRVLITLSDPRTVVDLQQEGDQVIAVLRDTALPHELVRRLDVLDFATPVQDDRRAAVERQRAHRDHRQRRLRADRLPVRQPVHRRAEAASARKRRRPRRREKKKQYTGEALTLNFQDIETRAVLQLLAEVSGQNIVVTDTVTGNVTLRLQNVPWDQALDIVLRPKGLDMRQQGQRHHRRARRGDRQPREARAGSAQADPGARARCAPSSCR